jgi:hypothetical protein
MRYRSVARCTIVSLYKNRRDVFYVDEANHLARRESLPQLEISDDDGDEITVAMRLARFRWQAHARTTHFFFFRRRVGAAFLLPLARALAALLAVSPVTDVAFASSASAAAITTPPSPPPLLTAFGENAPLPRSISIHSMVPGAGGGLPTRMCCRARAAGP